jgi:trehalose-phosphatase
VLLFDYDGSLAPLARHPALARLDPATRRELARLARVPRVVVGIVSGRSVEDVKRMVRLSGLAYAGTGGLEVEIGGRLAVAPEALRARALVRLAADGLEAALAPWAGAWIERKPLGVALHYRGVARRDVPALCRRARRALRLRAGALRTVTGPMALEVTAATSWTKGTAVRTIVGRLSGGVAAVLYAGDAESDREAFRAALALGGVAVGVGPRAPAEARHRLSGPVALARLVARLAGALGAAPGRARPRTAAGDRHGGREDPA